ncbi:MAG TPA: hypothetical protein VIA62_15240 [Thermoanaerobaculia bacterium]|jgi:hypothetical protein|nr:hypothetical protein [Thermoanaerobaculia bacterium]
MNLLEEISSTLEAAGIRHALIGALALSAYGINRASVDLDLFAADASCLRPDLWADLQSRGVDVQIRKGDLTDPLAGVVRFQAPGETPVDIVVGKFAWQTRLLERAEPIGGILVVRAADLVLLKLYAGGLQDAWDVQQLLARPFREDLVLEVESRLSDLPARCQGLWKKILQG